ncbi:MAG: hypothetical protein FWD85_11120 [Microbacteriaceae bacterium]|nr:hypothetical protein [Microbacteriaceae bacterium]
MHINITALITMYVAAGLLALIFWTLLAYWVLRLAITHAMKAHTTWVERGRP